MDRLWSPWRSKYIDTFKPGNKKDDECLFCRVQKEYKDKENYLVERSDKCFVIMNLYPYNSGHLMIVPYLHKSTLEELDDETKTEIMKLITKYSAILKKTLHPEGYNIGCNIGKISGAGIADHVHFHLVPRWSGDTSFMAVIDDVKVISASLDETYEKLKEQITKSK